MDDKNILGLVLNWLGNSASLEQLRLCREVIDKILGVPLGVEKPVTEYTDIKFMGLDFTPLMQRTILEGNSWAVENFFIHIKGYEKMDVINRIEEFKKTYAHRIPPRD